jgi:hypothetical protein
MPKYGHWGFGQAKPSVLTRLGAPRRLLTSRQGRTERGAGPTPDERVEEWRQAGQASGVRGGAGGVGQECAWSLLLSGEKYDGTRKDAKAARK